MPDGVVCCGPARVCWRILSCISTLGEVSSFLWPSERILITYKDWRKPPYPVQTADYATYIQLITWFLDSSSPLCPFSVHRMALAGKDLGKEVGQWFGPSTAAGAIKYVNIFRPTSISLTETWNPGHLYTHSRRPDLGSQSLQTQSYINPRCTLHPITQLGRPSGILGNRGVTEEY